MAKASDNPYPSVLVVEGSAPTSPPAGDQRLFIDSADHKLKRVNSSGTVTTIEGAAASNDVTLVEETTPSSPAAGSQKLFIDSADHKVKRVNSSGTVTTVEGSSGGGWDNNINLPLSTLTGWTAGAGTWTVASSVIKQTATAATPQRLHLNTLVPLNDIVVEWEQRVDAATSGQVDIVFGTPPAADGDSGFVAGFTVTSTQTTAAYTEVDNQSAGGSITLSSAIAHGTWYKTKVHKSGGFCTYWMDTGSGYVLVGSFVLDAIGNRVMGRLAFKTYNAQASFRNLKVWNPTMPV